MKLFYERDSPCIYKSVTSINVNILPAPGTKPVLFIGVLITEIRSVFVFTELLIEQASAV